MLLILVSSNIKLWKLFVNLFVFPFHMVLVSGLITRDILIRSAGLLPAVAIGMLAGVWLARRTDQAQFRQITLGVLILTGIAAIASGLGLF